MKEKQKRERRGIERAGESFIPLSKVAVVFILFSLPLPPLFFYFLPLVPSAGRRTWCIARRVPRRRVWIRFSRQIPCLQAAATFLFGIQPRVSSPFLLLLFSFFPSTTTPTTDATVHGRTAFLAWLIIASSWVSGSRGPPFSLFPSSYLPLFCLDSRFFFSFLSVDPPYLLSSSPSAGGGRNAPDRRTLRGIMKRHPAVNDFLNKMTPSGGRFKDKLSATGKLSIIARSSPM